MSLQIGTEEWYLESFGNLNIVTPPGHYIGNSGLHMDCYVEKRLITSDPDLIEDLAVHVVASNRTDWEDEVEVVVGTATGAIVFGWLIARTLGCKFVYPDKVDGRQVLGEGAASMISRKRVLLAEDIVTTGSALKEVAREVRFRNSIIVGAAAIWRRSTVELGFPLKAAIEKNFPAWSEQECPLCRQEVGINLDLGHGLEFMVKHGSKPEKWPANSIAAESNKP